MTLNKNLDEGKLSFYPQGLLWMPWNRWWMFNEARYLSKNFNIVRNPQDADFIVAFDPVQSDIVPVLNSGKPIVWRVFAGYSKSPIEDARGRILVALYNTEFTKSDFLRTYPYELPPMELIYHPLNEEIYYAPRCSQVLPFYVYVGSITKRKRVDWVVEAAVQAEKPILLFYPSDIETDLFAKVFDFATKYQGLIGMSYNYPPSMVYMNMSCALALVSASSWETFYIPGIETAYLGRPLIATQLPVLDELWEDTYIKVNSKEELAEELRQDYTDLDKLNEYGRRMNERLKQKLWDKGVGNFTEKATGLILEYLVR